MRSALFAVIAVCVSALTWETVQAIREVRSVVHQVPEIVEREAAATRDAAALAVVDTRSALMAELRRARMDAVGRLDAKAERVVATIERLPVIAEAPAARASAAIDQWGAAAPAVIRLSGSIDAAIMETGRRLDPWTDCRGNGACVQAQAVAGLGAVRFTAGQVARSSRSWEADYRRMADASVEASTNAAAVMANLRGATDPIKNPWLRWFVRLAPPAAGLASGVAGTMAATGSFR